MTKTKKACYLKGIIREVKPFTTRSHCDSLRQLIIQSVVAFTQECFQAGIPFIT